LTRRTCRRLNASLRQLSLAANTRFGWVKAANLLHWYCLPTLPTHLAPLNTTMESTSLVSAHLRAADNRPTTELGWSCRRQRPSATCSVDVSRTHRSCPSMLVRAVRCLRLNQTVVQRFIPENPALPCQVPASHGALTYDPLAHHTSATSDHHTAEQSCTGNRFSAERSDYP
jgi:hypothetical protein